MRNKEQYLGKAGEGALFNPGGAGWGMEALWPLLERQVALYTGGESSSVPLETAAALMESVVLCLGAAGGGHPSLAAALRAGQRALWQKTEETRTLYLRLRAALRPSGSQILRGTVEEIGNFFIWYDIRFFAQSIPCMIDYPLLRPVSEEEKGVHFITEYLCRMDWENRFCRCFKEGEVRALLERERPDYQTLPLNICEVVFARALGGVLSDKDPVGGALPGVDPDALAARIVALDGEALAQALQRGTARLCNRLRLWGTGLRGYFGAYAATLAVRVQSAGENGVARLFAAGQL